MVTFLCAMVLGQRVQIDHVDMRINGRIHHNIAPFKQLSSVRPAVLFLNGKSTGLVFDELAQLSDVQHNAQGRAIFTISQSWSGAYTSTQHSGFTTLNHRLVELPFAPEVIDRTGRIVGTVDKAESGFPVPPEEAGETSTAYVWIRGQTFDLGPAFRVRFAPDGVIETVCATDQEGKVMSWFARPISCYEVRRWRDGQLIGSRRFSRAPKWVPRDSLN